MQPRTDRPKYLLVGPNRPTLIPRSFTRTTHISKFTRNPILRLQGEMAIGRSSDGDPVVREAQEANHEPVQPRSDIFIVNSERISEIRTNEETDLVEFLQDTLYCSEVYCYALSPSQRQVIYDRERTLQKCFAE